MKHSILYRGLSVLLTAALVLLMAACAQTPGAAGNTTGASATTTTPVDTTAPQDTQPSATVPQVTVDNPVTFFSMNLNESYETNDYLMAYVNDDGSAYVEYVGDVKKVAANMDAAALHGITAELQKTALADLNGQSVYEEGETVGSVYAQFQDESMITADFSGSIPQEYVDAYEAMEIYFAALLADVPVYVPKPVVAGEVNSEALAEMEQILDASGMEGLDMLQISDVAMDENFAFLMGLSGSEGILNGTSCTAMMITTPYSLVIATVEDAGNLASVREDFQNNLDWGKWVCVMPTNALIAQKGNMVLCLMGADAMFQQTAAAIGESGWTDVVTVDHPDL